MFARENRCNLLRGDDSTPRNLFAIQIGLSVGRGGLLPPSIHIDPQFVILRDSEGSPIAQNKNIRDEILRLSAQNDKRAIRESPLQIVGNGLDRSANLPIYWGGGARKARDGGAKSQQNSRAGRVRLYLERLPPPHFYHTQCPKKRTFQKRCYCISNGIVLLCKQ